MGRTVTTEELFKDEPKKTISTAELFGEEPIKPNIISTEELFSPEPEPSRAMEIIKGFPRGVQETTGEAAAAFVSGGVSSITDLSKGLYEYGQKIYYGEELLESIRKEEGEKELERKQRLADLGVPDLKLEKRKPISEARKTLSKEHPIATTLGGVGADIGLLIGAGLIPGPADDTVLLSRLGMKYPQMARVATAAMRGMKQFGAVGLVKGLAEEKELSPAIARGLKAGGFGAVLFGPGAVIKAPAKRVLTETLGAGVYQRLLNLYERHKKGETLQMEDFLNEGITMAQVGIISALNVPRVQRGIKAQEQAIINEAKALGGKISFKKGQTLNIKQAEKILADKGVAVIEGKVRSPKWKFKKMYAWSNQLKKYVPLNSIEAGNVKTGPLGTALRDQYGRDVFFKDKFGYQRAITGTKAPKARIEETVPAPSEVPVKPTPKPPVKPAVKVTVKPVTPKVPAKGEEYVYHGTSTGPGINIQKEGLRVKTVSKGVKQVSLSEGEQYALTYAQRKSPGREVMLRIKKTSDMTPDERITAHGDIKSLKNIPPENIEIKTAEGKWVPLKQYDLIEKKVTELTPANPLIEQAKKFDTAEIESKLKEKGISETALPKVTKWVEIVTNKDKADVNALKKSISILSDAKMNPSSRKVFTEITGVELPKTQKASKEVLHKYVGLELEKRRWLNPSEVKKIVTENKGAEVFIDTTKRDWQQGREATITNPQKNILVSIDGNAVVYKRAGHIFETKIANVRDIVIKGKSELEKLQPAPIKPEVQKEVKPEVKGVEEKPLFKPAQTDEIKLLEFNKMIKGEGFTAVPASSEMKKFIRNLPENIRKREAIKLFEKIEKQLAKPIAPSKVARVVKEVTGVKKISTELVTTEEKALKERIKSEARGAKFGEKSGRKRARREIYLGLKAKSIAVKEVKQTLKNYVSEHLSGADKNAVLRGLDKVTTKHQLSRRLQMVDAIEDKRVRQVSVNSLKKTIGEIDFKRLRPEFKGTIEKLVNSIDLVNRQDRTIDRLNRMVDYIKKNPDHNIPPEQLSRLDVLARTPQKNLTVEDIDLIKNSIQHLVHLQDLKNKIIIKRKVRDSKETKDKAIVNIQKKKTPITDPRRGIQTSKLKQIWTTESINTELMSWMLDGAQKNDTNHEVFYENIDDGVSKQLQFSQQAEDFFTEKVGDIPLSWSEKFNKKETDVEYSNYILESGKKIKMTRGERIAFYLHSLNEDNLRHILDGGIRFKTNPNILYKITTEDLANIVGDVKGKELEVVNAIHEYYNTIQNKKLNEISMKLNGWEIATEENYFPIDVYGIDVPQNYLLRGETLPNNMKSFTQFTLEGMGMLKARTKGSNPLVLDDAFSTTNKSIQKASAYYGLAAPLRTAKALLYDPDFKTSLTNAYGPHYWANLNGYIRAIEGELLHLDNFEKLTTDLINKLDTAVLGLNPFVMLKQPVSFMAAGTEIDLKYLEKALIGKPETTEVMGKYSPQLRDRFKGNVSREMGELGKVGQTRKFWTHKEFLNQKIMAGIKNFDYQAIGRIWKAVEYETNDLHPSLKGDERMKHIAARTEEVVRLTQPTFHIKDRSAIGRSPRVITRLLTKYSSQRNKNYMMLIRNTAKYNNSQKTFSDKRKFFKSMSILLALMPLLIMGIDELRNLAYKRKRPKREKEHFLLEYINNVLGQFYFISPTARSAVSKIERGTFAGYDVSDVFTSTINTGVDAMANAVIAIRQGVDQERYKSGDKKGELKWKTTSVRALNQATSTVMKLKFGLPYDTVKKLTTTPFKWMAPEKEKKKGTTGYQRKYKGYKRKFKKQTRKTTGYKRKFKKD